MAFRPTTPTAGPPWLPALADSTASLFRRILPAPLKLFRVATADLPSASEYTGSLAWDTDEENVAHSDGTDWKYWSFSDHVHAASEITNTPAGGIAATNVQAALNELDTEKLAASSYTAADVLAKLLTVDGAGSGLDADLLDGQSSAAFAAASHGHAISDVTGLQTALDGKQASDALLTSIASLTFGSDSYIYGTGSDTAAAGTITSAGRALIDDANAAAQRTTLGLGSAALKNTGTSGDAVPLLNAANTWSISQTIVHDQDAGTTLRIDNANSGTSANAGLDFRNGALGTNDRLFVGLLGTGFTGVAAWQDAGIVYTFSNVSGGLILGSAAAAGVKFEVNFTQVAAITSTGLDVVGLSRCDSFRIDQSPTSETITCTHTITISVNGTNYKIPIKAA